MTATEVLVICSLIGTGVTLLGVIITAVRTGNKIGTFTGEVKSQITGLDIRVTKIEEECKDKIDHCPYGMTIQRLDRTHNS